MKIEEFRQIAADAMGWKGDVKDVEAFDDRQQVVDMWRDNGVPCAQVAPGRF